MDNKVIGKYLQQKRKEAEMTQSDLAKKLNVTYQAVSRWETGESIPDIQQLDALATFYHVSVDEILQRETEHQQQNEEPLSLIMFMVIVLSHVFGFIVHSIFVYFDLRPIGQMGYFFFIVAGLFLQHMTLVTNQEKTNKDIKWYIAGFIPLFISLMIIALSVRWTK